jgi:hypothetical protein
VVSGQHRDDIILLSQVRRRVAPWKPSATRAERSGKVHS